MSNSSAGLLAAPHPGIRPLSAPTSDRCLEPERLPYPALALRAAMQRAAAMRCTREAFCRDCSIQHSIFLRVLHFTLFSRLSIHWFVKLCVNWFGASLCG